MTTQVCFYLTSWLVRLLCATTGLEPGEIKIDAANAHIYQDHISQVELQLKRASESPLFRFPELEITKKIETLDDWKTLSADDCILRGYRSFDKIKAKMAI